MSFRSIFFIFLLGISCNVWALTQKETPIKAFAHLPKYGNLQISPDGKHYAAVLRTDNGESVLAVIDADNLKIINRLNISGVHAVGSIYWANSDRIIASLIRNYGFLDMPIPTGEWIGLSVKGKNKGFIFGQGKGSGSATLQADSGFAVLSSLLPKEPNKVLMTVRNGKRARLIKLDVYSGRSKRVSRLPGENSQVVVDIDGNPIYAKASRSDDKENYFDIYKKSDGAAWERVDSFIDDSKGTVEPISFAGKNSFYVLDTRLNDTSSLVKWDLESEEPKLLYNHPEVDINSFNFDRNGSLYSMEIMPNYPQSIIVDPNSHYSKWHQDLSTAFKGALVNITSASDDGTKVVASIETDKFSPAFYLYEPEKNSVKKILDPFPLLKDVELSPVDAVTIEARDGVKLQGYLTTPKKDRANGHPMIVIAHGGPHGVRDEWGFDHEAQLLADRGYAVLQINYRGSGGYGRKFLYSGYGKWGAEMQDDLTDATNWAINAGIANKDKICIYGASYGGYAALMGGIREPDLYKCVVGYVGVYDLDMMFEVGDISQRQSGINYLRDALGTDKKSLQERSPVYNVDKLKAPLMIVHGEKDIRAHFKHALVLRKALDEIDYEYEWLTKKKEAHGFIKNKNREELYNKLLQFFDEHIGDA
ncbi:alpha/beta hydrolase family protein [Microbulbifer sp. SSSA008]|uniref:alpha/beta hydrolase family protein n=1 Tax=Microbulbifer sp. SSSA008 TaxID=3243380 RepID=UPI00403951EF